MAPIKCILLVLGATVAGNCFAQVKESAISQKSDRSTCANIVALTGDVKINCSNLTVAQRKAIETIPSILKMAISNQEYLEAIKTKLDEMAKTSTPQTVNYAPQGIAISGGQVTNPTVNNNLVRIKRNIEGQERTDLIACLKKKQGILGISALNGDAEAGKFAQSLLDIFKEAGWSIDEDRVKYVIPGNGYIVGSQINFRGSIDADGSNPVYDKELPGSRATCFVGMHIQGKAAITPVPTMDPNLIGILIGQLDD